MKIAGAGGGLVTDARQVICLPLGGPKKGQARQGLNMSKILGGTAGGLGGQEAVIDDSPLEKPPDTAFPSRPHSLPKPRPPQ